MGIYENEFGKLALFFAFGILLSAIYINVAAYAQNKTATSVAVPSAPKQQQHLTKIKITSPTRAQHVPVGKDLTVSGTSIDNAAASTNDCKVSVIVNKVRPYQPATPAAAAGAGSSSGSAGATDYSKWNFVLTSKYTTIKPGPNRITAKYECVNNPALTSFSSVNVTGVPVRAAAAATAATGTTTTPAKTTTTTASAAAKQQQQQHIVTTNSNNPASAANGAGVQRVAPVSNVSNKLLSSSSIAPQVKGASQENAINQQQKLATVSNGTAGQNSILASPPPVVASDKLMYLGYHGDSTNNDLTGKSTTSTKLVSKHGSSTTDNGSIDKGSVDIKSSSHKSSNTSTSQINTNRNTDNGNNNFIFPFSYP